MDHGVIETPVFMPVGTAGTVKGVHIPELQNEINAKIILSAYLATSGVWVTIIIVFHSFLNRQSRGFTLRKLSTDRWAFLT